MNWTGASIKEFFSTIEKEQRFPFSSDGFTCLDIFCCLAYRWTSPATDKRILRISQLFYIFLRPVININVTCWRNVSNHPSIRSIVYINADGSLCPMPNKPYRNKRYCNDHICHILFQCTHLTIRWTSKQRPRTADGNSAREDNIFHCLYRNTS